MSEKKRAPTARKITPKTSPDQAKSPRGETREPKSFAPAQVKIDTKPDFSAPISLEEETLDLAPPKRPNWLLRLALGSASLLISLGIGLYLDNLVRQLFVTHPWLGTFGLALTILFVLTLVILGARELLALFRLRKIDRFRARAKEIGNGNGAISAQKLVQDLQLLYENRSDLAEAKNRLAQSKSNLIDDQALLAASENLLMRPLDERAQQLITASGRRVALVTAISPRALFDVAYVGFESLRLLRQIARLYGARPGFFAGLRLTGAVLAHLALTGGIAATESIVQELLGKGMAAKISAKLGEGFVNAMLTCRVGIAAMQAVRPLPFKEVEKPKTLTFATQMANVLAKDGK